MVPPVIGQVGRIPSWRTQQCNIPCNGLTLHFTTFNIQHYTTLHYSAPHIAYHFTLDYIAHNRMSQQYKLQPPLQCALHYTTLYIQHFTTFNIT